VSCLEELTKAVRHSASFVLSMTRHLFALSLGLCAIEQANLLLLGVLLMTSRRSNAHGASASFSSVSEPQDHQSDHEVTAAVHVSAQTTDPEWKLSLSDALVSNVRAAVSAPCVSIQRLLSGGLPSEGMTWAALSNAIVTSGYVPDRILYAGVRFMIADRVKQCHALNLEQMAEYKNKFVADLKALPTIAQQTAKANEQHYEVPYAFFELVLGTRLKYSSCYYEDLNSGTLDAAEISMLELYRSRAQLAPGQRVLDLGCGWGSLTLYFAASYPTSHFVAVSNSQSQKELILARARQAGLTNVEVITQDVNTLTKEHVLQGDRSGTSHVKGKRAVSSGAFDRGKTTLQYHVTCYLCGTASNPLSQCFGPVLLCSLLCLASSLCAVLSIEMMEHCKNYEKLFALLASILKPGGKMFSHIFVSREFPVSTQQDR
jgi:tRNA G46 methylase TrmB